ncbi:hypothetical protein HID58_003736 [Brassica napus]|uniref:Disease resistance N-terminal domain-containing protein n=1 Tax=Brassica napus TaxID=3708 RepID=A0ABQ8EQX4_BRANA|nr:hypothetical protein HID58_003736 [Brassica napus]
MASATVDVGIGLILSLLENETLLLSGVHSEIEKMKKELLIIKSFLEDTHKQDWNGSTTTTTGTTTTTQLFQTFVSNIRDLAYQMHDVIREIALSISKAERFCDKEMRSGTVRRTNLHTLLVCTKHSIELPPSLKLLRALDLEGSGISKLPEFLVTLFNLKYLNLSKTEVKELPRDFHRLINLETLNTRHSKNVTYLGLRGSKLQENSIHYLQTLPKLVWLSFYNAYMGTRLCFAEGFENLKMLDIVQMKHLKEVVIEDGAMVGIQKLYIRACRVLESVPRGIKNLVNLQELHLSHVSDQLVERIRGEEGVDRSRVKHIPAIKHHFRTEDGSFYVSLSS